MRSCLISRTRTKTSIRYAKENDREKRERKKGRRRDIEKDKQIDRQKHRQIDRQREREREREKKREKEKDRETSLSEREKQYFSVMEEFVTGTTQRPKQNPAAWKERKLELLSTILNSTFYEVLFRQKKAFFCTLASPSPPKKGHQQG